MNSHILLKEMLLARPNLPDIRPPGRVDISTAAFSKALGKLTERIDGAARRAAKAALANLEMMKGLGIYHHLDEPRYREAAALAEVLRNSDLIHNAGTLDVATLQQRIHHARERDTRLVFELGWGQAKRHAGFLKTAGPGADLSEIIALGRCAILARAAMHIHGESFLFRIICGGDRFREALFTSVEADAAFNDQRRRFVTALGLDGVISFDGIDRYWAPATIREALDRAMAQTIGLTELHVQDVDFAIFNIDWVHLLGAVSADRGFQPHGLPVPRELAEHLITLDNEDRAPLLRRLLTAVARREFHLGSGAGLSSSGFVAACEWVMKVATCSARKYLLLGQLTPRGQNAAEHPIALTVLEKGPHSRVPRLMLLGKRTADRLPQHIVAVLHEDGAPRFSPYIAVVNEAAPVHIVPDTGDAAPAYPWLAPSAQPLCLTTTSAEEVVRALGQLELLDIY